VEFYIFARSNSMDMKIKKLAFLFVALAGFASCGSHRDVYEPHSMEELSGHTVALMEGSVQADYAQANLMDKNITFAYYPSMTDCMLSVRQGKTDVYFGNDLISFNQAFRDQHMKICHKVTEINAPTAFAVKKGNDKLRLELNAFIDSLKMTGEFDEICNRWLNPDNTDFHDTYRIEPIPADPIDETNVLKVGISGVKLPSQVLIDNKWTGYEIEFLQRFAAAYGYNLKISTYDFHNLIPAVNSGSVDVIAATLIISPAREKNVDFTSHLATMFTTFIVMDRDAAGEETFLDKMKASAKVSLVDENRWLLILDGLKMTLIITLFALLFGSVLGGFVCALKMSRKRWKRRIADVYIYVMRNTPMLVFLMIMFYVVLAQSGLAPSVIAIIAFSMNSAAFIAEIYRTGIQTVDKGQVEAGRALGCSAFKTFVHIVAPQAAKKAIPVYKNECITLLKGTSIVGYISIIDLTKGSDLIRSASFEAFFPLIIITIIYFILASVITWLLDRAMSRL